VPAAGDIFQRATCSMCRGTHRVVADISKPGTALEYPCPWCEASFSYNRKDALFVRAERVMDTPAPPGPRKKA
jgi:hypothetical protein